MTDSQLLADIRDANLTYLMLAQTLIRKDRAEALFRLGLSDVAADMLAVLSPAQVLKTASTNMLLCRFRVDDDLVWNLLTDHGISDKTQHTDPTAEPRDDRAATSRLHANMLMAGRFADAL